MIPGYRITHTLYTSKNSIIYRGVRQQDATPVILKVLNSQYPSPESRARFREEYAIISGLDINGVVSPLGFERIENQVAIVLKDISGNSLDTHLKQAGGAMSPDEFLPLAIRITGILEKIHDRRIIHKDINPTNIIWNPDTDALELIDFGISTELNRETQAITNPEVLEGTLSYMSPEQTGRMNRMIDFRSDLYSLGATFYRMLSGNPPFTAGDAMEMVHCHIARPVPNLHATRPKIPVPLSDIVMKLMSKMAEDRYHSASGLKADLSHCLNQLDTTGDIQHFALGTRDPSSRFVIPQKLYGRTKALSIIGEAFSRVCTGGMEMVLISGYSGVGKSSLAREMYKPVIEANGFYITGKFDQFHNDIPYHPILEAFKTLVHQLLTEPADKLALWKKNLTDALGDEAGVMTDVIPSLSLIIGETSPVVSLSGIEAQKRFNTVFKRFIQIFCSRHRPLVVFLDDLQWADPASLKLLHTLMTRKSGQHLLILGAYRDNEVSDTHPLMLALDGISQSTDDTAPVIPVTLSTLALADTKTLVRDTLSCDLDTAAPLAELIHEKTGGNPFFIVQLFTSLYHKGLLNFDGNTQTWTWDTKGISEVGISENVAELLAARINHLPTQTRSLLLRAACLGNTFDLATLSIITRESPARVSEALWTAVQEELLIPQSRECRVFRWSGTGGNPEKAGYKFYHDKVQEAAYSELSKEERADIHLNAGRLLLEKTDTSDLSNRLFDIANHLNFSSGLMTDQREIDRLAELNLEAGRRAKQSTAFDAALEYFTRGMKLLGSDGWERKYTLCFHLTRERIECEFLCGSLETAHRLFNRAVKHTKHRRDTGSLYELMIRISHINYEYDRGIELGKAALALFDITIPDDQDAYDQATESALKFISERTATEADILALENGPAMTDANIIVCCGILHELWVCLFMSAHPQVLLPALDMIRLSLRHGQSAVTSVGHIFYGLILSMQQDYDRAWAFGNLAMALKDKYFTPLLAPKVHNTFCNFINHYKQHIHTNVPIYEASLRYCIQSGEIWWGAWAASFIRTAGLVKGDPLPEVKRVGEKYATYIQESEFAPLIHVRDLQMAKITHLMDETGTLNESGPDSENANMLDTRNFSEAKSVAAMADMPFGLGLFWHYTYLAFLHLIYGNNTSALAASLRAEENKIHIPGLMMYPDHFFFHVLILAANWEETAETDRPGVRGTMKEYLDQMALWQSHCPENFSHRFQLMTAAYEAVDGNELDALHAYDRSIALARKHGYLHHEALANELAARFHLENGREQAARGYLMEARYLYLQWGAKRKVRMFDMEFPWISMTSKSSGTRQTILTTSRSQALDLDTVMKASQAISGEIVLEKLLVKLMSILMENAGAQSGSLIIDTDNRLLIKASGKADKDTTRVTLHATPVDGLSPDQYPSRGILNYASRTRKSVVLEDAANQGEFMSDPYVLANAPESILCVPLVNQGKLDGLLYLENNLTPGAFTPDRLETLALLSTHAAIAIENAALYTNLEERVAERTQSLSRANQALEAEIQERKRAETALKAANRELQHLASLDGLTQIANRRYFDTYLATEWQRMQREKFPIALMLCDIDDFKAFNDTYGHQEGDDCLKQVASAMTRAVKRPADLVARYGGEEFALVLPNSDLEGASHIAAMIQEEIRALGIAHANSRVSRLVTVSIGIHSLIPDRHTRVDSFIFDTDQALYRAKNEGRNRIVQAGVS
ncbi:MAG: diguanylate cyclase [Desulfobacterales bacterium]|nr:diguanylate cyclase [Desulfobacterales bacterium]